jgi:hypothetical protein
MNKNAMSPRMKRCAALLANIFMVGFFACVTGVVPTPAQQPADQAAQAFNLQQQASALKENSGGVEKMTPEEQATYNGLLNQINALQGGTVTPNVARTINNTLTADDPTFNRPLTFAQGGNCTLSAVGTAVRFKAIPITLTCSSNLTISLVDADGAAITPTQADTFLALYGPGGFNPAMPCANAIAANDDAVGVRSRIVTTTPLAPGNYTVVVTSFANVPAAPGALPWSYSLFVSDVCPANVSVTNQVQLNITGQSNPPIPTACPMMSGYTNEFIINANLVNSGMNTLQNPFFMVTELREANGVAPAVPFRLLTADGATCTTGGLVGAMQSVAPGTFNFAPGSLAPVQFRIALPTVRRFRFVVDVMATVTSGMSVNSAKPNKIGRITFDATGVDKNGDLILSAVFTPEKGGEAFKLADVRGAQATPTVRGTK